MTESKTEEARSKFMSNQSDKILSFLNKHKDTYTSGQAMADSLGISRAAIWKAIENLRTDGYDIESVKATGYRLKGVPDILGIDGVDVSERQLLIPRKSFCQHDLTQPWDLGRQFDAVLCLEVAEHLAEARARGGVVSRDILLREIWGYNGAVVTHTLETHIHRLRRKLETARRLLPPPLEERVARLEAMAVAH